MCVPTRDRLGLLQQSLGGILAQDHVPLEIVISDNWSSDGTRDHCVALAERDARVRYVRPAEPLGLYANHNFALRHATGAYVCFFHDDDLYRPTVVSRYAAFLDAHPLAGVVSSDHERIDELGRILERRRQRVPEMMRGIDYIERTLASGRTSVLLSGSMIRREALGADPFDENGPLGFTDMVTWSRLAERYAVGHISEVLWSYRIHPGAFSRRSFADIAEDHERAFGAYCDEYLTRHPAETDRVARWRRSIRRFGFWARFYDATARLASSPRAPGGPAFGDLDRDAPDPVAGALVRLLRLVARAGARWPFVLLARYGLKARSLTGMG